MPLDLNSAEKSRAPNTLIPKNTIVPVQLSLRPGGSGEGGWLKNNQAGTCLMLDCEFTVIGGEYERRKFWTMFVIEGETAGQKTAADITKSQLRAMLESARGIKPDDESEQAQAARRIEGFDELDNLRFVAVVGVRKQEGYDDKNTLAAVVTPDRKDWAQIEQLPRQKRTNITAPAGKPAAATGAKKPSWAVGGDAVPF